MYETLEFYDSNGYDLKEALKSCIYKYYIINKNLKINSDKALIKDAKKEIKDVKFENITINNETNTNYIDK